MWLIKWWPAKLVQDGFMLVNPTHPLQHQQYSMDLTQLCQDEETKSQTGWCETHQHNSANTMMLQFNYRCITTRPMRVIFNIWVHAKPVRAKQGQPTITQLHSHLHRRTYTHTHPHTHTHTHARTRAHARAHTHTHVHTERTTVGNKCMDILTGSMGPTSCLNCSTQLPSRWVTAMATQGPEHSSDTISCTSHREQWYAQWNEGRGGTAENPGWPHAVARGIPRDWKLDAPVEHKIWWRILRQNENTMGE